MNISQLARKTGLTAKTIRYYESIGLIPAAVRTEAGYRTYGDRDITVLQFIARSRSLGFSVEDVGHLLTLWQDRSRTSAEVKALAAQQVAEIDRKVAELTIMRQALTDLMQHCHGDDRPDCPILDRLAGEIRAGQETDDAGEGCCEHHSSFRESRV